MYLKYEESTIVLLYYSMKKDKQTKNSTWLDLWNRPRQQVNITKKK